MSPSAHFLPMTPATTSQRSRLIRILVGTVGSVTFLVLIALPVFLIVGEEAERRVWAAAPSTLHLYTTDQVCRDDQKVMNCGHCGHCSNVNDIKVYHETSETLTNIMTECASKHFLWGQDTLTCLQNASNLSTECAQCWVGNYECNMQHCQKTCVKHRIFPFLPSLKDWKSDPLDPCIVCDEKLCGPGFVECAGANRRRAGIVSDIERDRGKEICDKVDWAWVLGQHRKEIQSGVSPNRPPEPEL